MLKQSPTFSTIRTTSSYPASLKHRLQGNRRDLRAQKYRYRGNTLDWEARAFGGLAFPVPIKKAILIGPTVEVDQEPHYIKRF